MNTSILTLKIQFDQDIVIARNRARQIANYFGFEHKSQIAIATAVSEIVRNAFNYANNVFVEFLIENLALSKSLLIKVKDQGKGIENLKDVLNGSYNSTTGMGRGIIGSKKLMDLFDIETSESGTTVTLGKILPSDKEISSKEILAIVDKVLKQAPVNIYEEVQFQNQELIKAFDELKKRQEELALINRELDDTNRGVLALYAELDERNEYLKNASDIKAKFFSYMSHEFRTPVNSILALSKLLLDRIDGDLTSEQETQVSFIKKSAEDLFEMVNDLLDIAKVESGKLEVKVSEFNIEQMFSTLRGILRPLLNKSEVSLNFEEVSGLPNLNTDEAKIAHIIRNFVSNAIKFTEKGEVNVSVNLSNDKSKIRFCISDTGIGIDPKFHSLIFEEFSQIDNKIQSSVKGTGLGLPLSKKLAGLLGGEVWVSSELGKGSEFYLEIPINYENKTETQPVEKSTSSSNEIVRKKKIFIVDDDEISRYIVKGLLSESNFKLYEFENGFDLLGELEKIIPDYLFLDLVMPGLTGFDVLEKFKKNDKLKDIPIIVATSKKLTKEEIEFLENSASLIVTKDSISRKETVEQIKNILK